MLTKVSIRNFRLLRNVEMLFDEQSTLIIGRNNSGKTSLAELFRRLVEDGIPAFTLQDFSLDTHEEFWNAYLLSTQGQLDKARDTLPSIKVTLTLSYDQETLDLGHLADFIVDLNPECSEVQIEITYALIPEKAKPFFETPATTHEQPPPDKALFFRTLKERLPHHFRCTLASVDPNDATNRKHIEWSKLRLLVQGNFISAQRGLDDITHKENDTLGKILNSLFNTAESESAHQDDRKTTHDLRAAVSDIQAKLDTGFNEKLKNLLPAINMFGYPGLADPNILTETLLDVGLLLRNNTKIRYSGNNGVHLPESYNGLGTRNLIYILLKLLEAFKTFEAKPTTPSAHVIFIEEPEAHLHPQMQEVFIKQLALLSEMFTKKSNLTGKWPVQFVVSTHSSHITNKVSFEAMRYFLPASGIPGAPATTTKIKDLKKGLKEIPTKDQEFLHQYLTLTRCDLLFADKAVLIEGTAERLMMPRIIEKLDAQLAASQGLGRQYVSIVEVGGAYAHKFLGLLDFLELKTLIITDLDSVSASRSICPVSQGTLTSNACINHWFDKSYSPAELILKTAEEKTKGLVRLAYQVPEQPSGPCGRSFEDAFILANLAIFPGCQNDESHAMDEARQKKKSTFALTYAIHETNWHIPRYIAEGLNWLAASSTPVHPSAKIQVAA
ncbi:ATP-dependent OLD family endonuclease [Corallococcus coralloides DSM 2259]|uniref:ATP-dependent OLD family endonuclease n=1 Tax=Corallococcus coralloides (strain ATCC 25202 / DSM 2259 / NBRC 100086 / M2) TaxID=1144275 RepID=H8MWD7_CORCM|nr:ATP-dependent endonuclease [Corallococcus coralloides]AFE07795.1 ATP-dependent OLD family endonuclease [Corallococcus coralloides DSM 2259]